MKQRFERFVAPKTGNPLTLRNGALIDELAGEEVAKVISGIPRFVDRDDDYAENFGWQWNYWENVQSAARGSSLLHARELRNRCGLWDGVYDCRGKTLLECGMGGGDDTEQLLTLPLSELHAFDISNSVDRANKYLSDPRLQLSQASIYEIPYEDESFDIVWCHRVIQHTPDPELAMRLVARKVTPGGFLFIHCYKRSRRYMREFKYKYRWLTKRLPHSWVFRFLELAAPGLHHLNRLLARTRIGTEIGYRFVPLYRTPNSQIHRNMTDDEKLEWEKLATFDALTPKYDNPMTTERFCAVLESEHFDIIKLFDPPTSPIIAQAIRRKPK